MAEQRRSQRPSGGGGRTGGKPAGGRSGSQGQRSGGPKSGPKSGQKSGQKSTQRSGQGSGQGSGQKSGGPKSSQPRGQSAKSAERSTRWSPDDRRGAGKDAPRRGGKPAGKPTGGRSGGRQGAPRGGGRAAEQPARTAEQAAYDGPELPAEITGAELDRSVTAQLKGLPEKLASRVARHLAAAGLFIDQDPELAYQHALAARARASRIAVVREATGEAAYAAGHYAEALAELRAAKRMNGATAYLPIMADCHRALGKPQEALKLAKSPGVANFSVEAKAEMTIVEAGARRDLGQLDAALRTLELAPLQSKSRGSWVVRLRYAYADTLEAAGREQDALAWFHRTHAIDGDDLTDAAERAETLERRFG
ncbi:tetratricopeptide repeat protein [Nocardioides sp. LMS-CY]|uniref:tetratricopeptide repeat protein n=1 Tax=Nocardioides sp. (strain LMS-CY) TaxID=2840457 RepID=UPI001BFFE6BF|nr:tetratricopeptide repeat protein [Nocardioides sp. LMS-CY]QWF20644.1 tetratricopeptide repeat protein [Nocardioides sp. LMS-CY]